MTRIDPAIGYFLKSSQPLTQPEAIGRIVQLEIFLSRADTNLYFCDASSFGGNDRHAEWKEKTSREVELARAEVAHLRTLIPKRPKRKGASNNGANIPEFQKLVNESQAEFKKCWQPRYSPSNKPLEVEAARERKQELGECHVLHYRLRKNLRENASRLGISEATANNISREFLLIRKDIEGETKLLSDFLALVRVDWISFLFGLVQRGTKEKLVISREEKTVIDEISWSIKQRQILDEAARERREETFDTPTNEQD